MPAYSFYHPLRPPAVANASAAQQIPETKPLEETPEVRPDVSPAVSSEGPSMHGKPSTEPLLPKPVAFRQDNSRVLHPVIEIASTRTSMLNSTQMLGNKTPTTARLPPIAILQEKNVNSQAMDKSRNWQHFPGKTHYHLGGRVQFGTQYFANVGTIILLLIPTGLYFAFPYPFPCVDLIDVVVADTFGPNSHLPCPLHLPTSSYYVLHPLSKPQPPTRAYFPCPQ
jgi:hypothetical protein